MDMKALQEERKKLYQDVYNGIIPKRVPAGANISPELAIQYAGRPLAETQWTYEGLEEIFDRICQLKCGDEYPLSFRRSPAYLSIVGSKSFVMGSNGFLQHPEIVPMEPDEYDEFIASPIDFNLEKIAPRVYSELDTDPITRSLILVSALQASADHNKVYSTIKNKLMNKYGYYAPPQESCSLTLAPFDYLANRLRGFTGASTDIRRYPEKVIAACEVIFAMELRTCIPPKPSRYGETLIPLHMAPFMREKDFERFYWPTFSKLVWALANAGQPAKIVCEHNWMRYLDYLLELPAKTRIHFEYADPQVVKDKLGSKFTLVGFYPLTLLKTGTKQQCLDKAKELLDILAPGGNYIFGFDKGVISMDSLDLSSFQAVMQYVENTAYDNAGEQSFIENQKGSHPVIDVCKLTSKYEIVWNDDKKKYINTDPKLESIIKDKLTKYRQLAIEFLNL